MENQGKRLLLAVGLALVVILGWNFLFPPEKPQPKKPSAGSGAAAVIPSVAPGVAPGPAPAAGAAPRRVAPLAPRPAEEIIELAFPGKVTARFSSYGGSLRSWKLADPRFARDATRGELLPDRADTGAFFLCVPDADCDLSAPPVWAGERIAPNQVRYRYASAIGDFEKTYTVSPDALVIQVAVRVIPKADPPTLRRLGLVVYAEQDPSASGGGSQQVAPRVWQSSTMRGGALFHTSIKGVIQAPRWEEDIQWTGFEHPYLLAGYAPLRGDPQSPVKVEKTTWAGPALGPGGADLMRTDILFPAGAWKAGSAVTAEMVAYLGPKSYRELDRVDAMIGTPIGFAGTIDFGWFGVIGRPLLWLLHVFYGVVGNWGVAIIFLTFLVKLATLYWTTKSMRSMKAMAGLAPQMKALQEKYSDDKQRLQVETMALYKQHGVNPIAGCLPIFLQMPIWIALYRMLSSAGELYQTPFIGGWIDDLTNTDPYYVLPVILVVTMFVQARLQPASVDSRQQKFLQYGMPLMFGAMSFFFPSGLSIYMFTNTVLSALHSVYMNKYDRKSLEIAERMKAAADAAGAASKGAEPAKGKGAAGAASKGAEPAKGKGAAGAASKGAAAPAKAPGSGRAQAADETGDPSADGTYGDGDSGDGNPIAGGPGAESRPPGAQGKRKKRRR
jgi:YidC/Oxa1 family membrane protein insertase